MWNYHRAKGIAGCILTIVLLAGIPASGAESIDADAYIKYREFLMLNAKHHRKNIIAILNNKVPAKDHLARHARNLHELAMMFPDVFPDGSDLGETLAESRIWEAREKFQAALKQNQQATANLLKVVGETKDLSLIRRAFNKVSKSCTNCHTEFRMKTD